LVDAKEKVALVTGANKGIGFAIAQKLARLGMSVLVAARDSSRGEQAAARIRQEGLDALYLKLDVTEAVSVEDAARTVNERFSRLDILINNAAIAADTMLPPSEASLDNIRKVFETNFFGVIAVKGYAPAIAKERSPSNCQSYQWSWVAKYAERSGLAVPRI
jgi:NAD(P)-dependent dehydrogenase (short-subunit alcohol dehydrogenase family)